MTMNDQQSPTANDNAAPSFEQALEQLEGLVEQLETGDLSLDGALQAYEQGVALQRRCHGLLAEAEQKVEILTRNSPSAALEPFDSE